MTGTHGLFSYLGVPFHRVPQVTFNLGAVSVHLASHLQTTRRFGTNEINTVRDTNQLDVSAIHLEKSQTCGGILEPA